MKKPKLWHLFRFECELHDYILCNLVSESERHFCKRKDRKGHKRQLCDLLRCHWNVCPRIKAGEDVKSILNP